MRKATYRVLVLLLSVWTLGVIAYTAYSLPGATALLADLPDHAPLKQNSDIIMLAYVFMQAVVWAVLAMPLGIFALIAKPSAT